MKPQMRLVSFLLVLLSATVLQAQQTSRVIPFSNVATTIPPSTPGQALTIQLWDAATGGNQLYWARYERVDAVWFCAKIKKIWLKSGIPVNSRKRRGAYEACV